MVIHNLKILPQYYKPVAEGKKTFEIRVNDRGFQAGDIVHLREYDPERYKMYTESQTLIFKIGYVLPVDAERVVFSLLEVNGE